MSTATNGQINDSMSIVELARDLRLSTATIVQCAAEGMLPLFFPTFPHDYTCFSVHKQRIDADQDAVSATVKVKKVKTHVETETKLSVQGLSMGIDKIDGVVLSREDCHELLHHHRLTQRLFPAAVWRNLGGYDVLQPIRGLGINKTPSDANEWQVACYDKAQTPDLGMDGRFPTPICFDIRPWQIFAIGEDVHRFVDIIRSPRCITALLQQDKDSGLVDVVADRPAYFSEKLIYLIETSERFWRTKTPIALNEYADRRKKTLAALGSDDFTSLFAKGKLAPGTRAIAARFIEPIFAREEARDDLKAGWKGYLSPELFKLMAAAKLFWSAPDIVLDEVLTHPKNEAIESYLRTVGISGNETSAAATLIRPEGAARGGNGTPRNKMGFERLPNHTSD